MDMETAVQKNSHPQGVISHGDGFSFCKTCGRQLTRDEIAVTRKLINRGATEFYCVDCLAAWFEVRPEDIRERIAYFRATGCTLFSREEG